MGRGLKIHPSPFPLYADGKGIDLGERLFEVQKLTAKAAMAFEILVLKNKILRM